jgi:hypothetical protein
MTIKLIEVTDFSTFYNSVKNQKLSIKTAYKLTILAKSLDTQLQFYREKLQEIIREYAAFDENGQPITIENGQGIKLREGADLDCAKAMAELQNMEVTIPDIKFSLDEFDKVELTAAEMTSIVPFIEE